MNARVVPSVSAPTLLLAAFLVGPSLAGCLAEEQGPFTVVEIRTRIEGEGPQAGAAACSIVPPTAAIGHANRTIEVADDAWTERPSSRCCSSTTGSCTIPPPRRSPPPFRSLEPSSANTTWRFTMRGDEHRFSIQADGGTVHVDGTRLSPGESLRSNVSFHWTNDRTGERYNYSGTIGVTSHGRWPTTAIDLVPGYDTLDQARRGGFEAARWQAS